MTQSDLSGKLQTKIPTHSLTNEMRKFNSPILTYENIVEVLRRSHREENLIIVTRTVRQFQFNSLQCLCCYESSSAGSKWIWKVENVLLCHRPLRIIMKSENLKNDSNESKMTMEKSIESFGWQFSLINRNEISCKLSWCCACESLLSCRSRNQSKFCFPTELVLFWTFRSLHKKV